MVHKQRTNYINTSITCLQNHPPEITRLSHCENSCSSSKVTETEVQRDRREYSHNDTEATMHELNGTCQFPPPPSLLLYERCVCCSDPRPVTPANMHAHRKGRPTTTAPPRTTSVQGVRQSVRPNRHGHTVRRGGSTPAKRNMGPQRGSSRSSPGGGGVVEESVHGARWHGRGARLRHSCGAG